MLDREEEGDWQIGLVACLHSCVVRETSVEYQWRPVVTRRNNAALCVHHHWPQLISFGWIAKNIQLAVNSIIQAAEATRDIVFVYSVDRSYQLMDFLYQDGHGHFRAFSKPRWKQKITVMIPT